MPDHRYSIGQIVRFNPVTGAGFMKPPRGNFTVLARLPAYRGSKQYRLESLSDGHQRVVVETELQSE